MIDSTEAINILCFVLLPYTIVNYFSAKVKHLLDKKIKSNNFYKKFNIKNHSDFFVAILQNSHMKILGKIFPKFSVLVKAKNFTKVV